MLKKPASFLQRQREDPLARVHRIRREMERERLGLTPSENLEYLKRADEAPKKGRSRS